MEGSETYMGNILEKSLTKAHSKVVYGSSDCMCSGITFLLGIPVPAHPHDTAE
jgi:hypothetical protein